MPGFSPVILRGAFAVPVRIALAIGLFIAAMAIINRPYSGMQADSVESLIPVPLTPSASMATYPVMVNETDTGAKDLKDPEDTTMAGAGEMKASSHPLLSQEPELPQGYVPVWRSVVLDDSINIKALKNPFLLGQTHRNLGYEHFGYTAWLFRQMADQVGETEWRDELLGLAADVDELGFSVQESGRLWFEGTPTANMSHLQVRSQILAYLNDLNRNAIHLIDEDEAGKRLEHGLSTDGRLPGAGLSGFLARLDNFKQNGFAQRYPETAALLTTRAEALKMLALNMELRWESRFLCPSPDSCTEKAVHMKVYVAQTLPEQWAPENSF